MVTVEGRDIRTAQLLTFAGSAASVRIPLSADMAQHVSVSAVVYKPRTAGTGTDDDPAVKVGAMVL